MSMHTNRDNFTIHGKDCITVEPTIVFSDSLDNDWAPNVDIDWLMKDHVWSKQDEK